jgi:hypothetical protein
MPDVIDAPAPRSRIGSELSIRSERKRPGEDIRIAAERLHSAAEAVLIFAFPPGCFGCAGNTHPHAKIYNSAILNIAAGDVRTHKFSGKRRIVHSVWDLVTIGVKHELVMVEAYEFWKGVFYPVTENIVRDSAA